MKILVVGQTPPPYHGQAIMIELLLKGHYKDVEMIHLRLHFSKDLSECGKVTLYKLFHLFYVIFRMIWLRLKYDIEILYYPPSGPNKNSMYRDMIVLGATRWLFKKVIFHFHAGGMSELYPTLSPLFRFFFRLAYFDPDVAIRLSEFNPEDGKNLRAKKEFIIPYGIEERGAYLKTDHHLVWNRILYVGFITPSKGILMLVEACRLLKAKGLHFSVEVMGEFSSEYFKLQIDEILENYQLKSQFHFLGVVTGEEKDMVFSKRGIFCFPTFFESETFGVVLLEAMQFAMPIVATDWRGIRSIVSEGANGYLVPIKSPESLAEKLELLLSNPDLAELMGEQGYQKYQQKFTEKAYHASLEEAFVSLK